MKNATVRTLLCLVSVSSVLSGVAAAGDCKIGHYDHFRPPTIQVDEPLSGGSGDTTNVPVTAPNHNKCPSPLVPQAGRILEIPMLEAGVELDVQVNFAMNDIGSVILRSGKFEQELCVTQWNAKNIRFLLPNIGVLQDHYVSIHVYRPDGYLVRQFTAKLVRSPSFFVVDRSNSAVAVRVESAAR